jgi:hypothetical protein
LSEVYIENRLAPIEKDQFYDARPDRAVRPSGAGDDAEAPSVGIALIDPGRLRSSRARVSGRAHCETFGSITEDRRLRANDPGRAQCGLYLDQSDQKLAPSENLHPQSVSAITHGGTCSFDMDQCAEAQQIL